MEASVATRKREHDLTEDQGQFAALPYASPLAYSIDVRQHGVVLFGSVPVSHLETLCLLFKREYRCTFLHFGIAQALHANMVLTTHEAGKKWSAEIDADLLRRFPNDPIARWLRGTDCGASSKYLLRALVSRERFVSAGGSELHATIPFDLDDFGRCERMLAKLPALREKLPAVVEQHASWKPIVARWSEAVALYEHWHGAKTKLAQQAAWTEGYGRYQAILADLP